MARAHGYSAYTTGCHCEVCKAAKASYMRDKRASARELRIRAALFGERYEAQGITHGYAGYQDHQCRCPVCTAARSSWDAQHPRKSRRKVTV